MKKLFLILSICILHLPIRAQQSDALGLVECIRKAGNRSPLNRQKEISRESLELRLRNLTTSWYPAVGLNAQASYNSETIDLSGLMENSPVSIPSLPLDQYKLWADVSQQLYDGGLIRAQKTIEKITHESELKQVEIDLLVIKQQTNQVYFSLLLTSKNKDILIVSLEELRERKKIIRSGVENGVLLQEDLLSMDAEELKIEQRLMGLDLARQQLMNTLSVLMDTTLSENTLLAIPDEPARDEGPGRRPEYSLFEMQKLKFDANSKLVSSAELPRFFAFSQLAYGRPGYNMISTDFHTFYTVGVGMRWNFLNYGNNLRQKKLLDLQKGTIDIRRENFDDQVRIQVDAEMAGMIKYAEMLEMDRQIVALRKNISAASFAKLTNGVITATDYLSDLNAELLAQLMYENHGILRLQSAYNYLLLQGKI
jgi:outer membrane protein TolC